MTNYRSVLKKENSDYLFLGVLALFLLNTFVQAKLNGYQLSVNNYAGAVGCIVALVFRLSASRYRRKVLAYLLLLGTLNLLSFTLGRITVSIGVISQSGAEPLGLNPIVLLLTLVYYYLNRSSINPIFYNLFHGTKEEQAVKTDKTVQFYLEKFSKCSPEEFKRAQADYNDYPPEAQMALRKLQSETEQL